MIKVIASDMDGTLLGDDHMPAPETVRAVKKGMRCRHPFYDSYGEELPRSGSSVKRYRDRL